MIKINVIVRDKSWKKQINNPKKFLEKNIQTINKKINFFRNENRDETSKITNIGNWRKN